MFDDQRKILSESVRFLNKPWKTLKPRFPFRELYSLGRPSVTQLTLSVYQPGYAFDSLGRKGHAGPKRRTGTEQEDRWRLLTGAEQRRQ